VIDKVVMAVQTRVLCNASVPLFDLDRFVEITSGERERVEESVVRFGEPLASEVVGEMAVIAGRYAVMA
jgi:hypothetical protein